MKNWTEEWAKGGRIWTKTTLPKVQIAIVLSEEGFWVVNSMRLHQDQLQQAKFNSYLGNVAGLDQCLAWVRQLLKESGEPEFDEAEAAKVLIEKD